jgi:hypothetical protein
LLSTTERPRERGQILVLFGGAAFVLLVIAALAFDVGAALVERRDEQNAADAAALAGARYLVDSDPDGETKARAAALAIALDNGFDDLETDENVLVHIPPIHGAYAAFPNMIEVQIEAVRPSIFAGVIGQTSWPIGAYAVATNGQNLTFPFSMLALNPTECKAIAVSGGGIVEAYANIQSNSSGADCAPGELVGFSRTGGSTIDVIADDATCRSVGIIKDEGASGSMTCDKAQNSFALPDPLRDLDPPVKPPLAGEMIPVGHTQDPQDYCPGANPKVPSETQPKACDVGGNGGGSDDLAWILKPGLYPRGLVVDNDNTAYLLPGIYWIGGGGIDVGGGGSIFTIETEADADANVALATWGGGVMIYNSQLPGIPGGPFVLNSNAATMKLQPLDLPDTDPDAIYNDIVIFQDRAVFTPVTLNGSSSVTEALGIIYVPGGQVKLLGNGGTLITDQVIADTFDIRGDGGTIRVLRNTGIDAHFIVAGLVE